MSDDESQEAFEFTVKVQRGNGTDDRDTLKAKVSAETVDELSDKVETVREKMAEWAAGFRDIQPSEVRAVDDDQRALDEVGTT